LQIDWPAMDEALLSEKQRERCKQFKGDQSHFFFGDAAGPPVEAVDPSAFKDIRFRRPWSLQKLFAAYSGPANPYDAFHVELRKKMIAERAKRTKSAGTALGVPDRQAYSDISKVKPGELLDYIVQHHRAHRAGPHYDVRKLLMHSLGSGKTLTAIGMAEAAKKPYTAVVPASLRSAFKGERRRSGGPQPRLVLRDRLQLPLLFGDLDLFEQSEGGPIAAGSRPRQVRYGPARRLVQHPGDGPGAEGAGGRRRRTQTAGQGDLHRRRQRKGEAKGRVTEGNADLLQQFDQTGHVRTGPNEVTVEAKGETGLLCQVVGWRFAPFKAETKEKPVLEVAMGSGDHHNVPGSPLERKAISGRVTSMSEDLREVPGKVASGRPPPSGADAAPERPQAPPHRAR
jgi:hypothetical protein